jgi:anti-anti-sigma factor
MEISHHLEQDDYHFRLSGNFTFSDHHGFRDVLNAISEVGAKRVTFNMAQLNFVDSAALGMLLLAREASEKHRKHLVLRGAKGQVKKMFDMARFGAMFTME